MVSQTSSKVAPDPIPPPLAQLHCALALVQVGEYACALRALAPTIHVALLVKTIATFHHFHPLVKVDLPLFVDDFHLHMNLVLDREAFFFMRSPHL